MKSGMKMMAVNEMRRRRDSRGRYMEGGQGGQMEMGYGRMESGQGNYSRQEGGGGRNRMEGGGGSGRMGGYDRMESEMRGGRMEGEMRGGGMESEMRGGRGGGRGGGGNRGEGGNSSRMEEGGASGGYWPGPHMPPYGDEPQRKIGFGANRSEAEMGGYGRMEEEEPSMRRRRDSRGRYMEGGQNQQEMRRGNVSYFPQERASMHHGGGSSEGQKVQAGGTFWMIPPEGGEKITREKGEKWVKKMKGDDPQARGEMWSYEDAKTLAEERGMSTEGQEMVDFYVVLNMMYNDFCKVAKKHGVDTEDYYADLAQAWLYDKDGKPPTEKLMAYHKYVIPHEED